MSDFIYSVIMGTLMGLVLIGFGVLMWETFRR